MRSGRSKRMVPVHVLTQRTAFHTRILGCDLQDQCGASNVFSIRGDEGLPTELRGPNYPNYAMNVGHQGEYAGISQAALQLNRWVSRKHPSFYFI